MPRLFEMCQQKNNLKRKKKKKYRKTMNDGLKKVQPRNHDPLFSDRGNKTLLFVGRSRLLADPSSAVYKFKPMGRQSVVASSRMEARAVTADHCFGLLEAEEEILHVCDRTDIMFWCRSHLKRCLSVQLYL